jgi:hypothetical protein
MMGASVRMGSLWLGTAALLLVMLLLLLGSSREDAFIYDEPPTSRLAMPISASAMPGSIPSIRRS